MPQKKNPDVLELTRGRTGRIVGAFSSVATMLKGLPLAYNRDLQEDKPPVFEATRTVEECLELAAPIVRDAELNQERIAQAVREGFLEATTLMEYLVRKGVPMRSAHELIGKLVRLCEDQGKTLPELTLDEFRKLSPAFDSDVFSVLGPEQAVQAFQSRGSTNPQLVRERLQYWSRRLDTEP